MTRRYRAAGALKLRTLGTVGATSGASVLSASVVDGGTGADGALLFAADLSDSLPGAFGFTTVDGTYTSLGGITSSTVPGGATGRVFRNSLPATSKHKGYRGQTDLDLLNVPGVPVNAVSMEWDFRFTTFGGLKTSDTKVGYGLAGAPEGRGLSGLSYGGSKLADSWTARTTVVPADYVFRGHPWCMAAYLYAESVAGKPYQQYGLRNLLKTSGGAYISPAEGVWYRQRVEFRKNTPGVEDGRYRVFIDGALVLDVPVQWNRAGQDIAFRYFISQTFCNLDIASSATYDQTAPTIKVLS